MSDDVFPSPIVTTEAPAAIGPYSQGVAAAGLLFVSGQLPLDPKSGDFVAGGIEAHAHQCLKNLAAVAAKAGTSLSRAVKVTVFLNDLADFTRVNQVYAQYFQATLPARSAVQVAALPKNAKIEIEAILLL
jgi:2-iminobutanoate/2-iminopropanoate deaminase